MRRHTWVVLFWLAGAGVILAGCGRFGGLNSKSAIKDAIDAHLKQQPGLALANMTTEVQDVKFDGDDAVARVVFRSKDAPQLKVEVRYTLRREGNRWEVQSSTPMGGQGGNPHGGMVGPGQAPSMTQPGNPPGKLSPKSSH